MFATAATNRRIIITCIRVSFYVFKREERWTDNKRGRVLCKISHTKYFGNILNKRQKFLNWRCFDTSQLEVKNLQNN